MIYETQEQLDEALAYWQKALRLQDWNISASVCRRFELGENLDAQITHNPSERLAKIKILSPLDYPPDLLADQDHEVSLVHELSHIHTDRLKDAVGDDEHHAALEYTVCSFADALVRLKKQIPQGQPCQTTT